MAFLDRLEVGGTMFELIEFSLRRQLADGRSLVGSYGVNVAKVREVVRMPRINPLASRITGIAGIFELRGVPIPAINLAMVLGDKDAVVTNDQQIIVTEFAHKRAGFVVSTTNRIRRVAWDKVMPPSADSGSNITGMTLIENNEFLFILDLEKILNDLETVASPSPIPPGYPPSWTAPAPMASQTTTPAASSGPLVLLVDDSKIIMRNVKAALVRAGFRVIEASDGRQALTFLEEAANGGKAGKAGVISAVVTDVEMPRMDGLTLTRKIRENPLLAHLPVVLHTSLSGQANQEAGLSVGANGYVVKNDLLSLVELLRECLGMPLGQTA